MAAAVAAVAAVANSAPVRRLDTPLQFAATVVTGFQRGSKELGWPTANLENTDAVQSTIEKATLGVYCGWATVGSPAADMPLYKAAVSIGWNPTYTGDKAVKQKMIEPYLLHEFEEDFYGQPLRLLVVGYIRPELKFEGETWLEDLKAAIANDVKLTDEVLSTPEFELNAGEEAFLRGDDTESEDPAAL